MGDSEDTDVHRVSTPDSSTKLCSAISSVQWKAVAVVKTVVAKPDYPDGPNFTVGQPARRFNGHPTIVCEIRRIRGAYLIRFEGHDNSLIVRDVDVERVNEPE